MGQAVTERSLVRYVALVAFNRIVGTHPHLVSIHQDVIMSCIDDPDISIRLQALDLGVAMVTSANLASVVSRLLRQLCKTPIVSAMEQPGDFSTTAGVEPSADSDGEDPEEALRATEQKPKQELLLPEDYKVVVIQKILDMCSQGTYANIVDFEWYLGVLTQLAQLVPPASQRLAVPENLAYSTSHNTAVSVGSELRNVAVRVKSVRQAATRAAESLVVTSKETTYSYAGNGSHGVLVAAVWVVGEYAEYLGNPEGALSSLLSPSNLVLPAAVLSSYLQAIPKIFSVMMKKENLSWDAERKTMTSLLLARMLHFLEPLVVHPSLEVQERAVGFLELIRVAMETVTGQKEGFDDPPPLLRSVIPSFFEGSELNPVAPGAQKKVPMLDMMDLDVPIHCDLPSLLRTSETSRTDGSESAGDTELFYERGHSTEVEAVPEVGNMSSREHESTPRQDTGIAEDAGIVLRRRAERRARSRDDPFYIANDDSSSGTSTPFHNILKSSNGVDVDIDAIPIMDLDIGGQSGIGRLANDAEATKKRRRPVKRVDIAVDENINFGDLDVNGVAGSAAGDGIDGTAQLKPETVKRSLLQVDSSGLKNFALEAVPNITNGGFNRHGRGGIEDDDMAEALEEVERLRLEMQRASERIDAGDGVPPDGTLVKKRRKKKTKKQQIEETYSPKSKNEADQRDQISMVSSQQADTNEQVQIQKKKNTKKKRERRAIE